jgi:hypothetical protein
MNAGQTNSSSNAGRSVSDSRCGARLSVLQTTPTARDRQEISSGLNAVGRHPARNTSSGPSFGATAPWTAYAQPEGSRPMKDRATALSGPIDWMTASCPAFLETICEMASTRAWLAATHPSRTSSPGKGVLARDATIALQEFHDGLSEAFHRLSDGLRRRVRCHGTI